jgi:nucleotide-binding universal stress UspA family protein
VWVVRDGGHEPPQALAAAVDLNQDELSTPDMARRSMNTDVLQAARIISQHLAMELHVVQAFEVRFEGYLEVRAGLDPEVTERMSKELMRDLNRQLNDLCRHELSATTDPATGAVPYHPHLERGKPAAVIAPLVKRKKIDLLVMGTMGRSGIAGMLLGNTAEDLLSEVECSVLVLKPPGFVSPVV